MTTPNQIAQDIENLVDSKLAELLQKKEAELTDISSSGSEFEERNMGKGTGYKNSPYLRNSTFRAFLQWWDNFFGLRTHLSVGFANTYRDWLRISNNDPLNDLIAIFKIGNTPYFLNGIKRYKLVNNSWVNVGNLIISQVDAQIQFNDYAFIGNNTNIYRISSDDEIITNPISCKYLITDNNYIYVYYNGTLKQWSGKYNETTILKYAGVMTGLFYFYDRIYFTNATGLYYFNSNWEPILVSDDFNKIDSYTEFGDYLYFVVDNKIYRLDKQLNIVDVAEFTENIELYSGIGELFVVTLDSEEWYIKSLWDNEQHISFKYFADKAFTKIKLVKTDDNILYMAAIGEASETYKYIEI